MKLAVLVAAVAQAKNSSWLKKEWEVQDAYFADEEIILSDLSVSEGLKKKYRIKLSLADMLKIILLISYMYLIHVWAILYGTYYMA